jgi:hypothetical protein
MINRLLSRFTSNHSNRQSDESRTWRNAGNDASSQNDWRARDRTSETNANNSYNQDPWRPRRASQNTTDSYTFSGSRSSTKYTDTSLEWRKPKTGNEDTERRNPFGGLSSRKHNQASGSRSSDWDRSTEFTSLQTKKNSNDWSEGSQRYDNSLL